MAIKKTYLDSNSNVGITDAYHKILSVRYFNGMRASVYVGIYNSKADRDTGKGVHKTENYIVEGTDFTTYLDVAAIDVVNQNVVERSYVYLKTLPEYSGAIDV